MLTLVRRTELKLFLCGVTALSLVLNFLQGLPFLGKEIVFLLLRLAI